jgi:hypothetical protein
MFGMSQNWPSVMEPVTSSSPTIETLEFCTKDCESLTLNSTLAEVLAG